MSQTYIYIYQVKVCAEHAECNVFSICLLKCPWSQPNEYRMTYYRAITSSLATCHLAPATHLFSITWYSFHSKSPSLHHATRILTFKAPLAPRAIDSHFTWQGQPSKRTKLKLTRRFTEVGILLVGIVSRIDILLNLLSHKSYCYFTCCFLATTLP